MTENVNVQYVGFEAQTLNRKYNFLVRKASSETREFSISIANEAFVSHRVSYQDAPNVCSLRLHRELGIFSNDPPQTHYRISETDLNEYRESHAPKAANRFRARTAAKQL
jgi:hypothetical protein